MLLTSSLMAQDGILFKMYKKITTTIVEEHFAEMPKPITPATKAKKIDYENEADTIKLNIPLMIRLLEYAREDIKKDIDIHILVENLVDLSDEGDVLVMKDYPKIVKIETED